MCKGVVQGTVQDFQKARSLRFASLRFASLAHLSIVCWIHGNHEREEPVVGRAAYVLVRRV